MTFVRAETILTIDGTIAHLSHVQALAVIGTRELMGRTRCVSASRLVRPVPTVGGSIATSLGRDASTAGAFEFGGRVAFYGCFKRRGNGNQVRKPLSARSTYHNTMAPHHYHRHNHSRHRKDDLRANNFRFDTGRSGGGHTRPYDSVDWNYRWALGRERPVPCAKYDRWLEPKQKQAEEAAANLSSKYW